MKIGWLAAIGLLAVLLASCGGGDDSGSAGSTAAGAPSPRPASEKPSVGAPKPQLKHLELSLSGWEGPESAAILTADKQGYFEDAGLSVSVLTPVTPINSIEYVVQGFDDLGVAPEPQVAAARAKGLPIVAVASLISRPTETMISEKGSGIDGIKDLKGKTIAIAGFSFQKAFLEKRLAEAGLSTGEVEIETVGSKLVPALVSGRAEAIFGGSMNVHGLELESRGLRPVALPVGALGFPPFEQLLVFARANRVAKDPKTIRAFASALVRGAGKATADPEAAVAAIDAGDEPDPEASRMDTEAEVEATVPLLSRDGRMSPDRARRLVAWMYAEGLIERRVSVGSMLTNGYLPEATRQR